MILWNFIKILDIKKFFYSNNEIKDQPLQMPIITDWEILMLPSPESVGNQRRLLELSREGLKDGRLIEASRILWSSQEDSGTRKLREIVEHAGSF